MRKKFIWVFLIVLLGALYWWHRETAVFSTFLDFLKPESLRVWIESFGPLAPIVFMVVYFLVTLFFISAAFLTILAGVLFGPFWGTFYVILAATASAQTGFYFGRKLSGKKLEQVKNKKGIGKFISLLEEKLHQNGFRNFFLLRCLFLPYMPLSYAAGAVPKARGMDFFAATLLTNMIFSPAFVVFGDSVLEGPKALVLPFFLIVLVFLVPWVLKRFLGEKV